MRRTRIAARVAQTGGRVMRRTLGCGTAGALCALVFLSSAQASPHELWIVGQSTKDVTVVDTTTNAIVGDPIPVGDDPRSIAFSPDGATAYVANRGDHTLDVIDTRTKTPGTPIDLGVFEPNAVAVAPDGSRIFVTGRFGLMAVDPSTGAMVGTVWQIDTPPPDPIDLAVSPDGTRAYAPLDVQDASVAEFDLRSYTGHEVAFSKSDRLHYTDCGCEFRSVAITPDGSRVVIGGDSNGILDTAARTLGRLNGPGSGTRDIAMTPDGASAYAVGDVDALWRYVMPAGAFDGSILSPVRNGVSVALNPAGNRLYMAGGVVGDYDLYLLDEATHAPVAPAISLAGRLPWAMAVTPNQPPVARFTTSGGGAPGVSVAFDAGAASDPDGTIARYDWDFGDGTAALDAGPRPTHVYATAGTFSATVTVTDAERCSTTRIYTGQSASCNGGPVARAAAPIEVTAPAGPGDTPPTGNPPTGNPPTGNPPPAADTRPPVVRLAGATSQVAGKTVAVTVKCDEACTATATGTLTVTSPAATAAKTRTRRFTLGRVKKTKLAAGRARTLRLTVSKAARLLLARKGSRGTATIRTVATDAAGNARHSTRKVKVQRRR